MAGNRGKSDEGSKATPHSNGGAGGPIAEGYVPLRKGYSPVESTNQALPKAPIGGTGESPSTVAPPSNQTPSEDS
jgi:hypothetical protein